MRLARFEAIHCQHRWRAEFVDYSRSMGNPSIVCDVRTFRSSIEQVFTACCLAAVCCTAGCAYWPLYMGPDLRRGTEQATQVDISYRLDAGKLDIPVAVSRVEGQFVSYDEVAGSLHSERTVGSMHITYPCPDAPADCARVEVQIDAAPLPKIAQLDPAPTESNLWYRRLSHPRSAKTDTSHETWALDLPKAELDQLMGVLATPGHVTKNGTAKPGGATLTTDFNGHRYRAVCPPVAELDALMRKVRDHGQLVAYSRPLLAGAQLQRETSAVALFREPQSPSIDGVVDPSLPGGSTQVAQTSGLAAPNASRVVYLPANDTIRR